jgi:hypothetical protein
MLDSNVWRTQMISLIIVVAVAIALMFAVLEFDHRINKNDPEVRW